VPGGRVPGSNGRPPASKARQPLDRPAGFRVVERDPASWRPWSCRADRVARSGFLTESSSIGIGDVARVRVQSLVANSLDGCLPPDWTLVSSRHLLCLRLTRAGGTRCRALLGSPTA